MTTPPRAVHAIPLERDPDGRGHIPFVKCWCGPVDGFRAIGTGGAVFVHRPFGPNVRDAYAHASANSPGRGDL